MATTTTCGGAMMITTIFFALIIVLFDSQHIVNAQSCANPLFSGNHSNLGAFQNPVLFEEPAGNSTTTTTQEEQYTWVMEFCNHTTQWPRGFLRCNLSSSFFAAHWGSKTGTSCVDAFTEVYNVPSSSSSSSSSLIPANHVDVSPGGNVTVTLRSPFSGNLLTVVITCRDHFTGHRIVYAKSSSSSTSSIGSSTMTTVVRLTGAWAALCPPHTPTPPNSNNAGAGGGGGSSGSSSSTDGDDGVNLGLVIGLVCAVVLIAFISVVLVIVLVMRKGDGQQQEGEGGNGDDDDQSKQRRDPNSSADKEMS